MPPNQADLFDDVDQDVDIDHIIAVKESTKQAAPHLVDLFPNKDLPCDVLDRKRTTPTIVVIDNEVNNNEYGNYRISEETEQTYDNKSAGKETNFLFNTVTTAQRGDTNAIHCVETALHLVKDISDISDDIDHDIDHDIDMEKSTEQAAYHQFDLLDDDDGQGTNTMVPSVEMTTTLLQQSSSYPGHHNQFRTSPSSMIVRSFVEEEERHVQFAGEVVMHYPLLNGVFVDAVTVIDIPHVSDYTIEEKRSMWYTREEMIEMKQMCLHTVHDILTQHQQKHNCSIVESLYGCSFFLRGLERYVDHYQQSMMNKSTTTTTTRRRSGISCTGRRSSKRQQQRQHQHPSSSKQRSPPHTDGGVASVLVEQYNQRLECLQAQGVVYGGILDPERLRHVYETEGKTIESVQKAQQLAQQDETDVHEYCTTTEFDESLSSSYHDDDDDDDDDHYHYHYHHHRKNRIRNENTIMSNNIMMNHQKVTKLFDVLGVTTILHTLITPFIEVRLGDMVVGVDHHASEWSF
mmetsp:Transcript_32538/g.36523  ORF Transcript_32538/g.36523 Transcript_32538/m.36523 type:complete len:518 (+) Transcript_32538:139-1692(+)